MPRISLKTANNITAVDFLVIYNLKCVFFAPDYIFQVLSEVVENILICLAEMGPASYKVSIFNSSSCRQKDAALNWNASYM